MTEGANSGVRPPAEYMGVLLIVAAVILARRRSRRSATEIAQRHSEIDLPRSRGVSCPQDPPALSACVVSEQSDERLAQRQRRHPLRQRQARGRRRVRRASCAPTARSRSRSSCRQRARSAGAEEGARARRGAGRQRRQRRHAAVTFVLPDAAAADKFEQQLTDSAIAIAAGPIGAHLLGKERRTSTSRRWSRPPSSTRTAARSRSAPRAPAATATARSSSATRSGSSKNLTEGKPNSGDITAYYRIEGGLSGEAGLMRRPAGRRRPRGRRGDGRHLRRPAASRRACRSSPPATTRASSRYGGRFQATSQAALEARQGPRHQGQRAARARRSSCSSTSTSHDGDVANALLEFVQGINPITGDPGQHGRGGGRARRGTAGATARRRSAPTTRAPTNGGAGHRSGRRRSGYRHQHRPTPT